MPRKVEWDWERHITAEEDAERLRLGREADELQERLDAIQAEAAALIRRATARAKAAGDKRKLFVL